MADLERNSDKEPAPEGPVACVGDFEIRSSGFALVRALRAAQRVGRPDHADFEIRSASVSDLHNEGHAVHNRFDRFAKDLLREVFETLGTAQTEVEVAPDPQRADLCFTPSPACAHGPPELGLFARMATGPCIIEPYREPPSQDEMRGCVRKQLGWHHVRLSRTERAQSMSEALITELEFPSLWVVSTGSPERVIKGFGLSPGETWPAGVYTGPIPAIPFWLVVLNELPEERGTLLLRLLGRGATLRRAMHELKALPPDAWEHQHAAPLLVKLRIELTEAGAGELSAEEEELIVNAQEIVQTIKNEARQEGLQEGLRIVQTIKNEARQEGLQEGLQPLLHLFARKLGRPLTDEEGTTIRQRLETVGPDRLGDVAVDFGAEALAEWLAVPDAR